MKNTESWRGNMKEEKKRNFKRKRRKKVDRNQRAKLKEKIPLET